ncbi:hypothetical protein F5Y19DRAFT_473173 [Xylariaceae sp. FL1651]|nr:hypothetical protein F5Y19DRAFT_473173 [Xylariaceae sp. FL1651]
MDHAFPIFLLFEQRVRQLQFDCDCPTCEPLPLRANTLPTIHIGLRSIKNKDTVGGSRHHSHRKPYSFVHPDLSSFELSRLSCEEVKGLQVETQRLEAPLTAQPRPGQSPVTIEELERLRAVIKNDPNDQPSALSLAKKRIEATKFSIPISYSQSSH